MATCSFCRSTLVREGEVLRRIGESAELFDDHSPLGLGTRGVHAGVSFTLVGRLQYSYTDDTGPSPSQGRWTAWHALFDNGRSAILSEDNGRHVMSWPQALPELPPDLDTSVPGLQYVLLGRTWSMANRVTARVHAMQGEWPCVPRTDQGFDVWELRNEQGEVMTIEASTRPPQVDVGTAVRLADLRLSGLPQPDTDKPQLKAQGLSCPACGSSLQPTLDSTQSIVCGSCKAVVDISKGLGADLAFFKQDNKLPPLIALGSRGKLSLGGVPVAWQVVGYQERRSIPVSADEECWYWREYLLYEPQEGFAFLVDALDGWSIVQPITGAPRAGGERLTFQGVTYRRKDEAYAAETTYVLGEFYWPVRKQQKSLNTDFQGTGDQAQRVLNREMAGNEVNWSAGRTLTADDVMQAFRIPAPQREAFVRDASVSSSQWSATTVLIILVIVILVVMIMANGCEERCGRVRDTYGESSQEYQQCRASSQSSGGGSGGSWSSSGGSYGGYSSGGSHK